MSVVGTARELPSSPEASFDLGKHTITRKHRVEVDSFDDGPIVVTAAVGVPRLFQTYSFGNEAHAYARCNSVDAQRVSPNSLFWEVTSKYETPEKGNEVAGQNDNPLLEKAEVSINFETIQVPVEGFWSVELENPTFKPVTASNGEVLDPPPMKDESRMFLTITRNEDITSPHPATGLIFNNTTNNDIFWGCTANQVKCNSITAQRQTKQLSTGQQFVYLKCQYTFAFKSSWNLHLLDHGSFYIPAEADPNKPKVKHAFITADGQPIKGLLDGSGDKLAEGGNPVYMWLQPYTRLNFSVLNLPQSFADVR